MPQKKGLYIRAILQRCWPDYAVLILLGVILIVLREAVNGNRRPFTPGVIEDSGFPYKSGDTVPSWTLQSIIWLVPTSTIIIAGFLRLLTPLQAHQHVMNFLIMYALTGVLTNCIKLQVGRPRPHFLARCFPGNDTDFQTLPMSSVQEAICTNEDVGEVEDAYKSFPSGHASYSASSGMYFTLFLMHVLRVYSGVAPAANTVAALVPVSLGIWVGLTRISDYEHHFTDVLVGALLGMTIATIFFYQAQAVKRDAQMLDTEAPSPHVIVRSMENGMPVAEAVTTGIACEHSGVSRSDDVPMMQFPA